MTKRARDIVLREFFLALRLVNIDGIGKQNDNTDSQDIIILHAWQ